MTELTMNLGWLLVQIPMADQFRQDGKIYVVISVILIILFGLFAYLFRMEKKLRRLEKELKENK